MSSPALFCDTFPIEITTPRGEIDGTATFYETASRAILLRMELSAAGRCVKCTLRVPKLCRNPFALRCAYAFQWASGKRAFADTFGEPAETLQDFWKAQDMGSLSTRAPFISPC